jgi:acyl dehydratase
MMGLFLEELELHRRVALGSYAFTRENMQAYSRKFDPVDFHVDEEAGRASLYGAMTAAGLHVASGWMSCFVKSNTAGREALAAAGKPLPDIGPSPGFKNMKWLKPVYAGDVVSYFTTAIRVRPLASRPGWGIASTCCEGVNQQGILVFSFEGAVMTALLNQQSESAVQPVV